MIVFPNAKINIGLNIVGKRDDGFHNLESIFYPIPWCDILEINPFQKFEYHSSGLKINGDLESNLVVKAFRLVQSKYNIPNVNIHLHKQIPMGAGLGGGSADASFTLTALNTLFKLNIPILELNKMADTLGSDCPFFIENTPRFVTRKGDEMESIDFDLSNLYIKLVNPNIHIKTADAFKGMEINQTLTDLKDLNLNTFLLNNSHIKNDFEKTVFSLHPILNEVKQNLLKEGAIYTSMTGTGSTIYAIYESEPKATFNQFTEKIIKI